MSASGDAVSRNAVRGLIRDFTDALGQQMYFWGRDVIYPDGNLLCLAGLEKRPSEGLDGTSCYGVSFEDDFVELHGACVGRFSKKKAGFLFIRRRHRCFLYSRETPPAPGLYSEEDLRSGPVQDVVVAAQGFLRWWLSYEKWIAANTPALYRDACYRAFRKLPNSRSWLPPGRAQDWLQKFAETPEVLERAREWNRCPSLAR